MFAVIKTGGKQYRVSPDDTIQIERIEGDEGSRVSFGHVLMAGSGSDVSIGTPALEGATVTAEVIEHNRSKKTISFKKRRRQNSRRKKGHRQLLTTVSILEILTDGAKPSREASGKSAQQRHEENEAAYLSSVGGAASKGSDAVGSDADSASTSTEGGTGDTSGADPAGGAGLTATGDAGAADPAGVDTDKSAIEAQEATADALAAGKTSGDAPDESKAGSSSSSEDDEAADREAEMAEEHEASGKEAGSTQGATPAPPDGPLFDAPEGEPDKLTKIKGIGPVAERQLNEQGITTFAQIAALNEDDIERIDAYMPFSAAQIRTWREQAEALK